MNGDGNYFQLDSMPTAGIVRVNHDGVNSFGFNCLVPNTVKENDVGDFICGLLDSIKDEVRIRKSWRFNEKRNNVKKVNDKPRPRRRTEGVTLKGKLDEALRKRKSEGR